MNRITCTFILVTIFLVSGCDARQDPEPAPPPPPPPPPPSPQHAHACEQDCGFSIELPDPEGPPQPPGAPAEPYRVVGGIDLDIRLDGNTGRQGAALLVFQEAVLRPGRGEGQNWLYTVRLTPGNNSFQVRPYEDGVCHDPGCRFVVINVGQPSMPSLINSPTIIIDPR